MNNYWITEIVNVCKNASVYKNTSTQNLSCHTL